MMPRLKIAARSRPRAMGSSAADRRPAGPGEARVIWFTGLSGAGKSTIAREVYQRLIEAGVPAEYLDGDAIRSVFPATGFTRADRDEHVRRVGFLASRLEHHGVVVICALISPYAESRAAVRRLCRRFFEVHVSTPLVECERRDVKGLYQRARRGELANFTGIDDAYEEPATPDLRIDTSAMSVAEAADIVSDAIAGSGNAEGQQRPHAALELGGPSARAGGFGMLAVQEVLSDQGQLEFRGRIPADSGVELDVSRHYRRR